MSEDRSRLLAMGCSEGPKSAVGPVLHPTTQEGGARGVKLYAKK